MSQINQLALQECLDHQGTPLLQLLGSSFATHGNSDLHNECRDRLRHTLLHHSFQSQHGQGLYFIYHITLTVVLVDQL